MKRRRPGDRARLGVPPMLLGIPGDNTFANYQEANRSFVRQTVLPLKMREAVGCAPVEGGKQTSVTAPFPGRNTARRLFAA
jgi:hypothetical protein